MSDPAIVGGSADQKFDALFGGSGGDFGALEDEPANTSTANDAFDSLLAMADPSIVVEGGKQDLEAMFDKVSASSEEVTAEPEAEGPRKQFSKADLIGKFAF